MSTNMQEKWLLYSTCDEDSNSEVRALGVTPDDTVCCVTGSGCRTLSMIAQNPKSVVSIDYSPGQNYLLELKLAAMRNLSYDTLLAFFGVDPCDNRWDIFCELEKHLTPEAARYFHHYDNAIKNGVLFEGRHELFYKKFVIPAIRLLFGNHFQKIFECDTIEQQREIFNKRIVGLRWRWLIKYGFSESAIKWVLNDKKYCIEINVKSVGEYMLERLNHSFNNHLAKDNHWMSLMLNGKYLNRETLPHFLLFENYEAIRNAKTDVRIVTDNLIEYAKTMPARSISKFSLSDVTSCVGVDQFKVLLDEVARISKDEGRLCYRNFLAKHKIPLHLQNVMTRDDEICSSLDNDDLAFAYSFEVASIAAA